MSKRTKFIMVTWIGKTVGALKKAKVSVEKAMIKAIIENLAVEIQTSDYDECTLDTVSVQDTVFRYDSSPFISPMRCLNRY